MMIHWIRYETPHNSLSEYITWWRHQMETFFALLAICAGNSPVPGEFPTQRSVTQSFHVFFDLCPNNRLSKQWWGWWFETPTCPLWCYPNEEDMQPGVPWGSIFSLMSGQIQTIDLGQCDKNVALSERLLFSASNNLYDIPFEKG